VATAALDGKVAIVTGGSRGIGFAIAAALLDAGASVMVTARDRAALDRAVARLAAPDAGRRVAEVAADLRRWEEVERLVEETVRHFGGLDILVNNAGVGHFADLARMSLEAWHETLDTNLTAVFYCCRAAIPHLRRRGGGWIINISSLAGKNFFAGGTAYCASKAGLNALSEALMQEVRYDDIRVSYVMPGSVQTGFAGPSSRDDEGWKLQPEDVARVVVDLVAHPARSLPSRVEIRPSKPRK
jgi:3-oxoacyl-[acyl-carrier protein] reductase